MFCFILFIYLFIRSFVRSFIHSFIVWFWQIQFVSTVVYVPLLSRHNYINSVFFYFLFFFVNICDKFIRCLHEYSMPLGLNKYIRNNECIDTLFRKMIKFISTLQESRILRGLTSLFAIVCNQIRRQLLNATEL